MAKKKKIICKHCKEMINETTCSLCGKKLTDECLVCHKELVYDEISNQNIHICGNDFAYLNSVDKDYDAYHLFIGESIMGTRNLICVQKDEEIVVAKYCQWDGYPEGQGAIILDFIHKEYDKDKFVSQLKKVKNATQKDWDREWAKVGVKKEAIGATFEQSNAMKKVCPQLTRDIGGEILSIIQNWKNKYPLYILYSYDFAKDGLFCEWCYVLNLDEDTLDVYRGGKEMVPSIFCDPEKDKPDEYGYCPINRIISVKISDIKQNDISSELWKKRKKRIIKKIEKASIRE